MGMVTVTRIQEGDGKNGKIAKVFTAENDKAIYVGNPALVAPALALKPGQKVNIETRDGQYGPIATSVGDSTAAYGGGGGGSQRSPEKTFHGQPMGFATRQVLDTAFHIAGDGNTPTKDDIASAADVLAMVISAVNDQSS